MVLLVAFIAAAVLFFTNFYSDELIIADAKQREQINSFAAGLTIAYLFLDLLPGAVVQHNVLIFFASLLFGFTLFHVAEKYVYQHAKKMKLRKELTEEHAIAFLIYHIISGAGLVFFFQKGITTGVLFFIPVLMHTLLSSSSFRHLHGVVKEKQSTRVLMSLAPFAGVIAAMTLPISSILFKILIGFIGGSLLYIVTRDLLPRGREGNLGYFVMGLVSMIGFLTLNFLG